MGDSHNIVHIVWGIHLSVPEDNFLKPPPDQRAWCRLQWPFHAERCICAMRCEEPDGSL